MSTLSTIAAATFGRSEGPWGILDWLPYALTIQDETGTVVQANRATEGMFGYRVTELLGKGFETLVDAPPERVASTLALALDGEEQQTEWPGKRLEGDSFPIEVSVVRCIYRGRPMTVSLMRDVTERKRLSEQLRLAQRMEAVGRLAGGIAHDFNNLLTVIRANAGLLQKGRPGGSELVEQASEIDRAARQAMALTHQLLAFSRQQVLQLQDVNINAVVLDTSQLLRRLIGEDVECRLYLDPATGRVRADPSQLNQVLLNLCVNARQAMPHGGRLTIETANAELTADGVRRYPYAVEPGAYVLLAVTDTGVGMSRDVLDHIFEPFFTTKEAEKGTGLGLATVYGIVKQSGGYIWAESAPGTGTRFQVYLRRAPDRVHLVDPAPEAALAPSHDGVTVLVVEDDEMVRRAIRAMLVGEGHQVIEAPDGASALEILRENGSIALVLTDLVMPYMGGRELVRNLRPESRPRVLYMSGYSDEVQIRQQSNVLDAEFIAKPFDVDELAAKIREVLSRPPS